MECPNLGYWCLTLLATIFQWRSVLLVSKIRLLANVITSTCIEYSSPWTGIELTTSVEIDIVSIVRCKSSFHTITAMVASDNMAVYNITFPYRWWYMSPHINRSFTRTMWSRSPWTVVGVPPFFINFLIFDTCEDVTLTLKWHGIIRNTSSEKKSVVTEQCLEGF